MRAGCALYALALACLAVPADAAGLREDLWAVDGAVHAIAVDAQHGLLYVGGEFTQVGPADPLDGPPVPRRNLAALDLASGEATGWDPAPNLPVHAMWLSVDGATLYIGGDFTEVGGLFRNRLAALDTAIGQPRPWNPGANGTVRAMIPSAFVGASLFVGGAFSSVSGATRLGVAEIGLLGVGALTGLGQNPVTAPGADIHALARGTDRLYIGGEFMLPEEDEPRRLAAVDLTVFTVVDDWSPAIDDGAVHALQHLLDQDVIYAGGSFTAVAGAPQPGVAAFDTDSGEALAWNPQLEGEVGAIASSLDRTVLYLGGAFGQVAGVARENLAAVSTINAALDEWQAPVDGEVFVLAAVDDMDAERYTLYAGGAFGLVGGAPRPGLAALEALAPERQPPATAAVPPGGFFNAGNREPIALVCDDGAGAGCAATYYTLDGSEPDTESSRYFGPLNILADTELRFFSVDHVGNVEAVNAEQYTFEIDPPVTTASPASSVFEGRTLRVTLSCTDTGSGCADTYYTIDGSLPTTASARYTGPIAIDRTTVLQYFSMDVAGNEEGIRRSEYVSNRGELGALAGYEMLLLIPAGLALRRRGREAAR